MTTSKYQIDMCHGPLFGKIVLFAMPLMFTYILQLLFNAVDLVVIGHYAPHEAMAAVGATMNLNSLVINIFIGISIGTNVLAARFFGAKDSGGMSRTVHTSMTVAIYGGIALMIAGLAVARPLLVLMDTPEEILPMSCTYIWICFCAIPFIMLYNFGCAILRAVGDTRRPLYFLIIAGIVNVLLNLFFVIVCGMDVGGVALATAISHGISAFLILKTLISARDVYRLQLKKLSVDFTIFKEMLKIGIPAGVQSSCFAVSNMIIQSSINSFGSLAMAGTDGGARTGGNCICRLLRISPDSHFVCRPEPRRQEIQADSEKSLRLFSLRRRLLPDHGAGILFCGGISACRLQPGPECNRVGNAADEDPLYHVCSLRNHGCGERRTARTRLLAPVRCHLVSRRLRIPCLVGFCRIPALPDYGKPDAFLSDFMASRRCGQRRASLLDMPQNDPQPLRPLRRVEQTGAGCSQRLPVSGWPEIVPRSLCLLPSFQMEPYS